MNNRVRAVTTVNLVRSFLLLSMPPKDKLVVVVSLRCNSEQPVVFPKKPTVFVCFRKRQRPPNSILPFHLLPPMMVQLCYKLPQVHRREPCLLPSLLRLGLLHCYKKI